MSAEQIQAEATCGAEFDFFLHVVTICARPAGHRGPHHPTALAGDEEVSE
ncbi:hypothetical protein [Nocardia fusca]|uniref:Uncharacterized protein n=1 Tax=Nocardia fusca TaxID=941183 RepID=A0ABV3FIK4_9NOCA